MARSRGPARPAPIRRAPAPQQTRSASTASTASVPARVAQPQPPAPVAQAQTPAAQGPGLFGQMASTAAGVAVGSTVGHMLGAGISGMFGGSSSPEAPAAAAAEPVQAQSASNSAWGAPSCEADAKSFTKCLNDNQGDMQICSWYLEQLKACQSMARNYNQ